MSGKRSEGRWFVLLILAGVGLGALLPLFLWQPHAQAGDTDGEPERGEEQAGQVDIKAYVNDSTVLSEGTEENPGLYVCVNWDDDDQDGWDPDDHSPAATYTPDKDDALISGNGCTQDDDLWKFTVEVVPSSIHGPVRLTFNEAKVRVYASRTKANPFASGNTVNFAGQPITLYMEGRAGSPAFRDVELQGVYVGTTPNVGPDKVRVTVFEVTPRGLFGLEDPNDGEPYVDNQSEDNERKLSNFIPGSSDRTGIISWDDANGDGQKGDYDNHCLYFGNCMETQGIVLPSGVTANDATFDFARWERSKEWYKVTDDSEWICVPPTHDWLSDEGPDNSDEDLTPSSSDHIYQIDGPGCGTRNRLHPVDYRFSVSNFRECVYVILYGNTHQCSDWFRWHDKFYIVPKDEEFITRGGMEYQGLGAGWIAWPDTPPDP